MDIYGKLKNRIQNLCQTPSDSALILAKVKNVDGKTCTVTIDELELSDVRLRAVVNDEESGIVITPTVGSFVMITDLSNGDKRDWAVVMYSEIDKVEFNGGKKDGLININDLTNKLNNLVDEVNSLKAKFNTHTHTVTTTAPAGEWITKTTTSTASDATKFNKSDYEDDKITH